jgi:hypothetical protein
VKRHDRRGPRRQRADCDRCIEEQGQHEGGDGELRRTADNGRAAKRRAENEEQDGETGEDGPDPAATRLEAVSVAIQGKDERRRNRKKDKGERDPVTPAEVQQKSGRDQEGRKEATGHPDQGSRRPRTFLYAPRRRKGPKGDGWLMLP